MWHTGVKLLFRGSCTWHWHTMDAKAVSSSSTTASETAGSNGKAAKLAKAPVSRTVHPIDSSNIQPSSVAPNHSVVSQSPALHVAGTPTAKPGPQLLLQRSTDAGKPMLYQQLWWHK